ncbi:MAG TPA: SgcJ/EcaC family oxidoreductase [Allosphingosinicella sp.]|nr:SgcJ/EcaC family oxidoreductase [Allosphingosinicella sp.]
MKRSLAISALALAVALAGCDRHDAKRDGHPRADAAAAANEVKRTEADMLAAWKSKDPARVAAFYADDAVIAVPGAPAHKGAAAIRAATERDLKDPAFALDFTNEATDVARSGEIAWTRGTFQVTFTDPASRKPQTVAGNYVTIFRKQDGGGWKAVADYAVPGAAESSPTLPLPPPKAGETAAGTDG